MMRTRAAVLRKIGAPLSLEELQVPDLKPGQVLVKMMYTGLCHTQLSEIKGLKGEDRYIPHVLGHEGSGIVVAFGEGVSKVKLDDHVVVTWIKGSGADISSTQYSGRDGFVNAGAVSTFMEYAVISENRLVTIPENMPFLEAALLGCAVPTGVGAVLNSEVIAAESVVAIFGVGGIGLGAVLAAKLSNASKIIAIDIHEHKLELAKRIGATHTINASVEKPLEEIKRITDGRGVDCSIEAAGCRETMENAFQCVRDNGGLAILAGNPPHGQTISINPYDLIRGKRIIGTWGGGTVPDRDIPLYVNLFLNRKLPLENMVSHVMELEQINEGFSVLESGKAHRVVLKIN